MAILPRTIRRIIKKALVYNFLFNPIERHRILYGTRGGWIGFSLGTVIIIVGAIYLYARNHITANNLLTQDVNDEHNLLWAIISQFADPGNLHMAVDGKYSAGIALLCALAGVVCLSGLLVSSIINFISQRSSQWRKGLITYNGLLGHVFFRKYVVIIGVNEQTATIVKSSLRKEGVKYVLVQSNRDIENARMMLNLKLDRSEEKRVVFYHGERTSEEDIKSLRIKDALELFILGEDMHCETEVDHDAFNMTCLENIDKYLRTDNGLFPSTIRREKDDIKRIKCHVSFEYQSTFMAFKVTHIYNNLNNDRIEFQPFNVHEIWAKKILVDNYAIVSSGKHAVKQIQRYYPLDTYFVNNEDQKIAKHIDENEPRTVHLVIVGMNQMGVALAMQAALLMHLPNFKKDRDRKLRTTITFIDNNAVKEGQYLMGRYFALFELCRYRIITCEKHVFDKTLFRDDDEYDVMWQNKTYAKESDKWVSWIDPMEEGRFSYIGDNFMDLQWEFIEGNIASPQIQDYLTVITGDLVHRTSTIAICLNNPQQAIATALYLPEAILKKALQVLVYQQNTLDMVRKVATGEKEWKRYEKLKPFGMIEGCYTGAVFDNNLAKFVNLVYENRGNELDVDTKLTDSLQFRANRLWEELGIVYKLANINFVDSINIKLRSTGKSPEKEQIEALKDKKALDSLSDAEHRRWLTERLTMSYRPLEESEKDELINPTLHEKDKIFFKNKYRSHIDINPIERIREWDRSTYDKDTDRRIINMIPTMLKWDHQAILRTIYLNSKQKNPVNTIALDMTDIFSSLQVFWIGRTPITAAQWRAVLGSLPLQVKRWQKNLPITHVSWDDISDFLLVLNDMTGLNYRLPTMDEWKTANQHREKKKLKYMVGKIWQWTDTKGEGFESSISFMGRSRKYEKSKWKRLDRYWLPNFKSSDLGFRLVLPFDFPVEDVETVPINYQLEEDDKHVIEELVEKFLVKINGDSSINMSSFLIMRDVVTQRQWKAVMRNDKGYTYNPSQHRGDYYPVENVSYKDACKFVKMLNKKNSKGWTFDLPTNEQWEYVSNLECAKQSRIWHNGVAKSTHKIEMNPQEGVVYNMYGNVWEWCKSWHDGDHPLGSHKKGIVRMLRGGSWRFSEKECLSRGESYWPTNYKADDLGFRIVVNNINELDNC